MSTLFLCLLASERRPFCALKMRPVRQVLLLARHAFEDAFNVAGCRFCAFENAFGGAGGCLAHL